MTKELTDQDRISALEARVAYLEEMMDTEPDDIVGSTVENFKCPAFKRLLLELERTTDFSTAMFRTAFREQSLRMLEGARAEVINNRNEAAANELFMVLAVRLDEFISDLIPPSIYDEPL